MKLVSAALVLLVACSCEPLPPEPPIVVVDAEGPCGNLRRLGCPEGKPNANGRTCEQMLAGAAEVAHVPTECLATARDVADVRACGSDLTLRVRCVR